MSNNRMININISSTAVVRSVCKHCGSPPIQFIIQGIKYSFVDSDEFKEFNAYIKFFPTRSYTKWLNNVSPSEFINLAHLKYSKHYNNFNIVYSNKLTYLGRVEKIICKCGLTKWSAFSANSEAKYKLGTGSRKGRTSYSKEFSF